ncbi:hypothetical protein [Marinomonas primoryensis]|jgi:hypothetical protein|uniref:hypothetical protein n=1 Tax=Marinomonas primoryensis TaxID=178399 RepID=UPI0037039760
MDYYFYPTDEADFKSTAVGNFVHTIVFDSLEQKVVTSFVRRVRKVWEQTCKNNIETDHRIKELVGKNYQIYSWVSKSKSDLSLPFFKLIN